MRNLNSIDLDRTNFKKPIVHFLHIGKTGGTAIIHALNGRVFITSLYKIRFHNHPVKLRNIPIGENVVFFLRDPISRFVSGFNSRKRKGKPKYNVPWTEGEAIAFSQFATPNDLALALSSEKTQVRTAAKAAMNDIYHVKLSFWYWFENMNYFKSRLNDILFIGFQENMDLDFVKLKRMLALPEEIKLPTDNVLAHRNPSHLSTHLHPESIRNLKIWYKKDYEFLELCKEITKKPLLGR